MYVGLVTSHNSLYMYFSFKEEEGEEEGIEQELRLCIKVTESGERVEDNPLCSHVVRSSKLRRVDRDEQHSA